MPERKKRLSWADRQQGKILRKAREDPETGARLRKSWFGRFMLQAAERTVGDPSLEVDEREHIELATRADRMTLSAGTMPGRLTLTDKRLIFRPVFEILMDAVGGSDF